MKNNLYFGISQVSKKSAVVVLAAILLVVSGFFAPNNALAVGGVAVNPATGAENISIDTTSSTDGTGAFTELSGPSLMETTPGGISAISHTISLPVGWEFDTSSSITVMKFGSNLMPASQTVVPSADSFTFIVTTPSTNGNATLGFSGIKIRPTGTTPSTGNMTYLGAGIAGVDGATNFGTLTTVAGAPTQLKIEDSAAGGAEIDTANVISGATLTAYSNTHDQFNNFVANVAATWSLVGFTGGVADGNLVPAGDNKSAVFTGNLVGTTVAQASGGVGGDTTGVITVAPGPVSASNSTVAVDSSGTAVVSGGANVITVTVTAKDAVGNPIPDKVASIVSSGTGDSISPATASTNLSGVATFTVSSTKAEAKTITATVDSVGITQTQDITFTHGAASQLAIVTQPSSTATAGVDFIQQPAVRILDQFGNLVDDDNATVITATRNSSSGTDVLQGTLTAMASGGGATFSNISYREATTIKVDFTSGSLTAATSNNVAVSPNVPATVTFTTQPASTGTVDAVLTTQPIVNVIDAYGNNVADGTSVTLSLATGTADALRGTLTITTTGGTATFNDIGYNKVDLFSITATAGTVPVQDTSGSVGPLSAGIINNFTLSADAAQIAGTPFTVSVSGAVDQYGNFASGTAIVSVSTGDGNSPSTASPTYGTITVAAGAGSANTTLVNAINTVLRGTVGLITSDTGTITVDPATASQVVLAVSPDATIDADGLDSATITGQLKDQFGNISTTSGVSVVITTDKGAVTATTVTDTNGQVISTLTSGTDITAGIANIDATTELTVVPTTVTFVDVTAPDAPIISAPTVAVYTNAANYTITGTAEANSLVQIYSGTTVVASQQLSGGGTSFSISTPLAQNSANNFTVTAKDAAGNESLAPTAVATINEDSIDPSVVSYILDNSVISPDYSVGVKDSATFDVAFSEEVNAVIDVVSSLDVQVKHIYDSSAVTNPDPKIWDGKNNADAYVADGVYMIKIVITDKAGNSIIDTTKTIAVDNTAPTVDLTYSANPAKASAITVTATYSEPIVGTPQITIDQQGSTDGTGAMSSVDQKIWTYSYTVNIADGSAYVDGEVTVSLSAVADAAGNTAAIPTNETFTIDTTVPTASITSPLADAVVKDMDGNVDLEFDSTDGVTCEYKVSTGNYQLLADCASPQTITLGDGRNSVVLKVTDAAGNFAESSLVSFVVDMDDTLTVGASGADFTTIQEAVTKATADDTIDVAAGTYAENVVVDKSVTLQGESGATIAPTTGHGIEIRADQVTVDGFMITPLDSTAASALGIAIDAADGTTGVTINHNVITTNGDNHGIWVSGSSNGNAPSTDLTLSGNSITVGGYADAIYAAHSFPAHSNWMINGNTTSAPAGDSMDLYDVDSLTVTGNTLGAALDSSVIISSILSDLSGPIVFSNNMLAGNTNGSMVAVLTDFFGDDGILTTIDDVTISGNTFSNWGSRGVKIGTGVSSVVLQSNKFTDTGEALNNLSASTVNATGNWWGQSTGPADGAVVGTVDYRPWCTNESCDPIDTDSPTVTVSTLLTNDTTPVITGTVSESSVVKINVNGTDYTAVVSGTAWTAGVTETLVAGAYSVITTAEDLAGNIGTDTTDNELTIDTIAPTVTLTKDHADTIIRDADAIVITATFSKEMTAPTISIGTLISGVAMTNTNGNVWVYSWDVPAGNDGIVAATVAGADLAGNSYTGTDSISFTIDNTAPVVAITQPMADSTVNAAKVIIFTDNGTTPQCSINNSTWVTCVSGTTILGDVIGFGALTDGSLVLYLRDTDTAGNIGTAQVALVKDTTVPSVIGKTPSANAVGVAPSTNITVTFDEDIVIADANVTITNNPEKTITFDSATKIATINPTDNLANNTTYTITLTGVTDTVGNALPETAWSFTTSASYSISLTTGWNLISLPVVPTNTSASVVLGTLDNATMIETVWKYDPETETWGAYHPGNPDQSNFSTMTAGEGYWINYLASATGAISGTGNLFQEGNSTPPQKTLAAGWNLIGYYQLENVTNVTATKALSTVAGQWTQIRTYSNTAKQFQSVIGANLMKPGEGYWIFMKSSSYAPYLYGPGDTD